MGLVANQVCSLEGGGEPTNPAKQFEMVEFPVSPPVNPMPAFRLSRIRDSSGIPGISQIVSRVVSPFAEVPVGSPGRGVTAVCVKRTPANALFRTSISQIVTWLPTQVFVSLVLPGKSRECALYHQPTW